MTLFTLQSMVGSDIAELLMQDCKKLEKYKRQPPVANLINLIDEDLPVLSSGTRNLLTGEIPPIMETPAQMMEKFTKLLYYGRKKVRTPFSQTSFRRATPTPCPISPSSNDMTRTYFFYSTRDIQKVMVRKIKIHRCLPFPPAVFMLSYC